MAINWATTECTQLVNLCNNFDRVIITNSYCDYGYKPSNNNLTVIDVCGQ